MADWDIFFQGDSISPPYSFTVPSRAPSAAPSAAPLSTQILTSTEQLEEPNNIIVIPNTDKKVKKKKAIDKPDNIKGAIPTEKLKYYQYLTFTAPRLYNKDIYNKENDLVAAIREAFGKDNKENLSNKSDVKSAGFEDSAIIQKLQNDLFNEQDWAMKNIRDQAEADADYIAKAPERLARAKNIFRTKVLKKAPLKEQEILPSQQSISRLQEPTADVFDEFDADWAEREKKYGDVWKSRGLRTTGRIIQREIIDIQNQKKQYKRLGEKVPLELAKKLRDTKGEYTRVQQELSKEENKKYKNLVSAPVAELEMLGKKVGRPKGSKNKPTAERIAALEKRDAKRAASTVLNKMIKNAVKKAEGKAPEGVITRSKSKAGKV
jgi:hypothetical protein